LLERFVLAARKESVSLSMVAYEDGKHIPIAGLAEIILGCKWADADFQQDILDIVFNYKIDVIIPCMDGATVALAKMSKKIKTAWPVVSPMFECVVFENKSLASHWFEQYGVNAPPLGVSNGLPVIFKKIKGFASRDMHVAETMGEYERIVSTIKMDDYLVQKLVKGREFSIDAYVSRDGRVLGCVTRERLLVIGGEVSNSVTRRRPDLEKEARRILGIGHFIGPVTLQAIEVDPGVFSFIEINPRFGGGVILSIESGADYPRLIIREALGRPVAHVEWKDDLLMTRSFSETFHEGYK